MNSKLRSSKRTGIATRSSTSRHATFFQLSNFKRHKHKRQKTIPSVQFVVPSEEDDDGDSVIQDEIKDETEKDLPVQNDLPVANDLPVEIDFDDAHDEWMANKKRLANGHYVYLCGKTTVKGKKCRRGCHDMIGLFSGCKAHYMWEENEQHD
jgi:hypothetical protein